MGAHHSAATRWHLNEPLDLEWRDKALCKQRPDLPWTPDTEPHRLDSVEMKILCAECPVRIECAEYGLTQPGGFYAGVWTPWKDGAATGDDDDGDGESPDRSARYSAREALRRVRDSATQEQLPLSFNTPRSKDARPLSVVSGAARPRRDGRAARPAAAAVAPARHGKGSAGAARAGARARRSAPLP